MLVAKGQITRVLGLLKQGKRKISLPLLKETTKAVNCVRSWCTILEWAGPRERGCPGCASHRSLSAHLRSCFMVLALSRDGTAQGWHRGLHESDDKGCRCPGVGAHTKHATVGLVKVPFNSISFPLKNQNQKGPIPCKNTELIKLKNSKFPSSSQLARVFQVPTPLFL